jgi:hypothetical protein
MLRGWILPALAGLVLPASPVQAVVILFSDFEAVPSPDLARRGYVTLASVDGWTGAAGGIEVQTRNIAGRAFSGRNLVELDTAANSAMSVDLARGRYIVSYWYSPRPGVTADSNRINVTAGGLFLDSVTGDGGRETAWQQRTLEFITPGGPLTFAAAGRSDSLGGYLDDITIASAAVPELATWAMLIIGFGMVGVAARRRRNVVTA